MSDELTSLRARMRIMRGALSSKDRRVSTQRIAELGADFLMSGGPQMIGGYFPVGDETTPLLLMQDLFRQQCPLALPRVSALGEASFHRWRPGDKLVTSSTGLPEPLEETDQVTPDYLLIPLLAFDASGARLGNMDCLYESALPLMETARPVVRIGVAFAEQEVDNVPAYDGQLQLECVITQDGVRQLGSQTSQRLN